MRFKVDENLPAEIAIDLRADGHDADTVADEWLAGTRDPALLARVQQDGRALLTMDKGIADIRIYPPDQYHGLVLFRPRSTGRSAVIDFVRKNLPILLQRPLAGKSFVVTESGIRTR